MPSQQEYKIATDNLHIHDWKVDYVITHCAPNSIQRRLKEGYEENELTRFLENVKEKLNFKKWFFGHYHIDKQIDEKYICLYKEVITIE